MLQCLATCRRHRDRHRSRETYWKAASGPRVSARMRRVCDREWIGIEWTHSAQIAQDWRVSIACGLGVSARARGTTGGCTDCAASAIAWHTHRQIGWRPIDSKPPGVGWFRCDVYPQESGSKRSLEYSRSVQQQSNYYILKQLEISQVIEYWFIITRRSSPVHLFGRRNISGYRINSAENSIKKECTIERKLENLRDMGNEETFQHSLMDVFDNTLSSNCLAAVW